MGTSSPTALPLGEDLEWMWNGGRTAGWHADTIMCCVAPRWSGLHVVIFTDIIWWLHLQIVQYNSSADLKVCCCCLPHAYTLSPSYIHYHNAIHGSNYTWSICKRPNQKCIRICRSMNNVSLHNDIIRWHCAYMLSGHVCPWWCDDGTTQCNGLALVPLSS